MPADAWTYYLDLDVLLADRMLSLTTSSDAMAGHDTVSTADVTSPQHAHGSVTVYCTSTTAVHGHGNSAAVQASSTRSI